MPVISATRFASLATVRRDTWKFLSNRLLAIDGQQSIEENCVEDVKQFIDVKRLIVANCNRRESSEGNFSNTFVNTCIYISSRSARSSEHSRVLKIVENAKNLDSRETRSRDEILLLDCRFLECSRGISDDLESENLYNFQNLRNLDIFMFSHTSTLKIKSGDETGIEIESESWQEPTGARVPATKRSQTRGTQ